MYPNNVRSSNFTLTYVCTYKYPSDMKNYIYSFTQVIKLFHSSYWLKWKHPTVLKKFCSHILIWMPELLEWELMEHLGDSPRENSLQVDRLGPRKYGCLRWPFNSPSFSWSSTLSKNVINIWHFITCYARLNIM